MITVLILAAGQSSRLRGTDKLMQKVFGKPILRRNIEMASGFGPLYVALPSTTHPRMALLDGTNAILLIVAGTSEGMGGSLRQAVAQLPCCTAFMLILADLISINNNDLIDLVDVMSGHPDNVIWRGATPDGRAGHPIIFDACLRDSLANLSGDDGGASIVKLWSSQTYRHRFIDDRARHDLVTPEDWASWAADLAN